MDGNRRVDTWNTIKQVAQELAKIGDEVNESYNIDSKVRGALDVAPNVYEHNLGLEIQTEDSFSVPWSRRNEPEIYTDSFKGIFWILLLCALLRLR
ncbi:hypothetical protein CRM22_003747 [Opisthorchis felineus]|uniref:Uncharacterized protein n=1 Tax=Opisthorchis felineus TaxID=147828 RepID=A0A4S2LZT0_OPIFE|nr:hypothetical protein CRM22_003747 [Opisthorchis felineus]